MDLIIFMAILGAVVFFLKGLNNIIFSIGVIDIFLRLVQFLNELLVHLKFSLILPIEVREVHPLNTLRSQFLTFDKSMSVIEEQFENAHLGMSPLGIKFGLTIL